MNVQFNTIQERVKYALRDFTSVGKGQSPFSFLTDEQVYQIHPERYAFYLQMLDALQDPNSGLLDRVLSIENKSRYARDELQRNSKDVAKALRYLTLNLNTTKKTTPPPSNQAGGTDGQSKARWKYEPILEVLAEVIGVTGEVKDQLKTIMTSSKESVAQLAQQFDTGSLESHIKEVEQALTAFLQNNEDTNYKNALIKALNDIQQPPAQDKDETDGKGQDGLADRDTDNQATGTVNVHSDLIATDTKATLSATNTVEDMKVTEEAKKQLIATLNTLIQASSAPVKFHEPSATPATPPASQSPANNTGEKGQQGGSFYTDMLDELEKNKNDEKQLEVIKDKVDTHPIYSPENEKISMTDRVIFIAVTFMIRGLALFLIDWGINSQLITTFNRAFLYYTLLYFTLFMVWALLVNAGTDTENIALKMAFYYVNWDANGIGRVLAHLAVQTFLIPIPFIVREPMQQSPDIATFEKRRAVYRVLSNFTFFVWVMTSIIALRY